MAAKIFLQGDEIKAKNIKKAISLLEKVTRSYDAIFAATSLYDISDSMRYNIPNYSGGCFLSSIAGEVDTVAGELTQVYTNLTSLNKCLTEGMDVMENADKSFRGYTFSNKTEQKQGLWEMLFGNNCTKEQSVIIRIDPIINKTLPITTFVSVELIPQPTENDCGPTSAYMVIKTLYPDSAVTLKDVINQYYTGKDATYLGNLTEQINAAGDIKYIYKSNMKEEDLISMIRRSIERNQPCIALGVPGAVSDAFGYHSDGHYVVISGIRQDDSGMWKVQITDPYSGSAFRNGNGPQGQVLEIDSGTLYRYMHARDDGGYLIYPS